MKRRGFLGLLAAPFVAAAGLKAKLLPTKIRLPVCTANPNVFLTEELLLDSGIALEKFVAEEYAKQFVAGWHKWCGENPDQVLSSNGIQIPDLGPGRHEIPLQLITHGREDGNGRNDEGEYDDDPDGNGGYDDGYHDE